MSEAYFNEYQKTIKPAERKPNFWNYQDQIELENEFYKKGYHVTCIQRFDHNAVRHNTWVVERKQVPVFIEALFQKRITVEVEAAGNGKANIIFVCDNPWSRVKSAIKRIPKVKQ